MNNEGRPLGTAIWCPHEPDVIDEQGNIVRRQPDCSICTYRSGCTETEAQHQDIRSIRRQMRGVWIHEEFKEAPQ